MATATFVIEGEVNVSVTITENIDGTLTFDLQVLGDTGTIGDLNAIYFDLHDDSLTEGLSVEGSDVTGSAFKVDGVTKVDSFTNMNGEVVKELGKFDGGVQIGTSGMAEDDIQSTSFTLSHATAELSLTDFSLQDFGIRLTSVGEIDGARDGSLKLGDTAPELTSESDALVEAIDDYVTVSELNFFAPDGFEEFEFLDTGANTVLANDTEDGMPYTGGVTTVNGVETDGFQVITGSNGGAIIMRPDGSFDFSAGSLPGTNDFGYLGEGESAYTAFDYTLDDGTTATLHVTVNGVDNDTVPDNPIEPPIILE